MGLLTGIALLPLAPVRGVLWTLEQAVDAARVQQAENIRAELIELERALHAGRVDEREFDEREDDLLDRLEELGYGA